MATVLVLGASRGIGLALVRQCLADGDRVIATARDEAGLARLAGLGGTAFQLDVASPVSVAGLAWHLDGEKIDLAVYMAGVVNRAAASEPPTQPEFDRVMHANVLGAMQAIPQVAPRVEAAAGRFVFVSSQMGRIGSEPGPDAWLYRVSKAALNMAVVSAQKAYPGAVFACVHPGWVRTDMGGPQATLSVEDSAASLRRLCVGLGDAQRGAFLNIDGQPFPGW